MEPEKGRFCKGKKKRILEKIEKTPILTAQN